jgi:translation initiation factor 2 subunit 2
VVLGDEYTELLDRAFSKLPSLSAERSDFVIPKADVLNEGTKTIVKNITQISDRARRKDAEIARYISKELSVPANVVEQRLVISGKFQPDEINRKVLRYFELYVICKECKKPDTRLEDADKGLYLVCEACGARYWIKSY